MKRRRLGRYEVKSLLARGGMAEVWLGVSTGVGGFRKNVVLKTILPDLAEDPDLIRMFINEALLAARLNHPHVVQILDLGHIDGRYYIAMEHVAGRTLRQISRYCRRDRKLLPPWFVLGVISNVCEGLQYAHDFCDERGKPLGLVHRDVTPENIMVSFTGTVKILDFGVAKANTIASATKAGTIKGKYAYVSPEQVAGSQPDRRSDIYAVGVMMYEMLTGLRPFKAKNELDLLRRVMEGNPEPPSSVAPWVPKKLEKIIEKAMALKNIERHDEAGALGEDINTYMEKAGLSSSQREQGLFLSSLFPNEPDIPSDMSRRLTSRIEEQSPFEEETPTPTPTPMPTPMPTPTPTPTPMPTPKPKTPVPVEEPPPKPRPREAGETIEVTKVSDGPPKSKTFVREDASTFNLTGLDGWEYEDENLPSSISSVDSIDSSALDKVEVRTVTAEHATEEEVPDSIVHGQMSRGTGGPGGTEGSKQAWSPWGALKNWLKGGPTDELIQAQGLDTTRSVLDEDAPDDLFEEETQPPGLMVPLDRGQTVRNGVPVQEVFSDNDSAEVTDESPALKKDEAKENDEAAPDELELKLPEDLQATTQRIEESKVRAAARRNRSPNEDDRNEIKQDAKMAKPAGPKTTAKAAAKKPEIPKLSVHPAARDMSLTPQTEPEPSEATEGVPASLPKPRTPPLVTLAAPKTTQAKEARTLAKKETKKEEPQPPESKTPDLPAKTPETEKPIPEFARPADPPEEPPEPEEEPALEEARSPSLFEVKKTDSDDRMKALWAVTPGGRAVETQSPETGSGPEAPEEPEEDKMSVLWESTPGRDVSSVREVQDGTRRTEIQDAPDAPPETEEDKMSALWETTPGKRVMMTPVPRQKSEEVKDEESEAGKDRMISLWESTPGRRMWADSLIPSKIAKERRETDEADLTPDPWETTPGLSAQVKEPALSEPSASPPVEEEEDLRLPDVFSLSSRPAVLEDDEDDVFTSFRPMQPKEENPFASPGAKKASEAAPMGTGSESGYRESWPRSGARNEASNFFEEGLSLLRDGDQEEALQRWESAISIDPDNRVYQTNFRKLKEKLDGDEEDAVAIDSWED